MLSKFSANLAVWSAFSLPMMPIYLGIQQSCFYVDNVWWKVYLGLLVGVFGEIQGIVEQRECP